LVRKPIRSPFQFRKQREQGDDDLGVHVLLLDIQILFDRGRNRRLSKDYEYSVQSSETLIEIAATRLILNRLAQA
jgi:hypothetical protein